VKGEQENPHPQRQRTSLIERADVRHETPGVDQDQVSDTIRISAGGNNHTDDSSQMQTTQSEI